MNDAQKKLVLAWIDKANNDIRNVELLLKSHEINLPTDTMAFHCQQAVEKYIKAYLTSKHEKVQFTHNLAELIQACNVYDKSFENIIEKAETLTPFAVEIRYPDSSVLPNIDEIKEYYQIAVDIRKFIMDKLNIVR